MIGPTDMRGMPATLDPLAANVSDRAPRDAADAHKVALQFEGILLKEVVSSLRKTATVTGEPTGGHPMYDHMMEQALTDHLAASGGVGLAKLFEPALVRQTTTGAGESSLADFSPVPLDGPAPAGPLDMTEPLAPLDVTEPLAPLDVTVHGRGAPLDIASPTAQASRVELQAWTAATPLAEQLPVSDDPWLESARVIDHLDRLLRSDEPATGTVGEKKSR